MIRRLLVLAATLTGLRALIEAADRDACRFANLTGDDE